MTTSATKPKPGTERIPTTKEALWALEHHSGADVLVSIMAFSFTLAALAAIVTGVLWETIPGYA